MATQPLHLWSRQPAAVVVYTAVCTNRFVHIQTSPKNNEREVIRKSTMHFTSQRFTEAADKKNKISAFPSRNWFLNCGNTQETFPHWARRTHKIFWSQNQKDLHKICFCITKPQCTSQLNQRHHVLVVKRNPESLPPFQAKATLLTALPLGDTCFTGKVQTSFRRGIPVHTTITTRTIFHPHGLHRNTIAGTYRKAKQLQVSFPPHWVGCLSTKRDTCTAGKTC